MNKITRLLMACAVALALSDVGLAQDGVPKPIDGSSTYLPAIADGTQAQGARPEGLQGGPETGVGGGVLEALPKPRDLPASLFQPAPPPPTDFLRLDTPYFTRDALLDPAQLPAPGWFIGAEVQVVKPHLISGLSSTVRNGNGTSSTVALPSASLNWTVAPRVFAGYRLPSGFGELMMSYRHLGADGGGIVSGKNGPVDLHSRFAMDMIDLDYNSRELSLGPKWDIMWTIGLRSLFIFFDSQANQPLGQATSGNGIFQARNYNNLYGIGPHGALELARRLGDTGWSLSARTDVGGTYDWTHQGFFTQSTTVGSHGRPLTGATKAFGHQAAPMINFRAGLSWRPSAASYSRFFVGYQYEVFWDLDRVSNTSSNGFAVPSLGQFWNQGLVLQASLNY